MKKFLLSILILSFIIPSLALADLPDLSDLSYDELVELKDRINKAMWDSQEWQEVIVPIGVWEVGKDIPVGHWSMSVNPESKSKWGTVIYCDKLDETGKQAGNMFTCKLYYREHLNRIDCDDETDPITIDIDCLDGTFIVIEDAPLLFTPYSGKPSLGFK